MAYISPDLAALLSGIQIARKEYLQDNATPHPARLELIGVLEVIAELIDAQKHDSLRLSDDEFKAVCVGAYLFCLENIKAEYRILHPEFSEGTIFNSGSKLYKTLVQQLDLTDENKMSDQIKLRCLTQFYQFAFKTNKVSMKNYLSEQKIDAAIVKQNVKNAIKSVFYYLDSHTQRLKSAIPTEAYMDIKMASMLEDYKKKAANNPDRILLAKIVAGVSRIVDGDIFDDDKPNFISASQRIKIGLLLSIMQSILDTYKVFNPAKGSVLYQLCSEALNIESMEDIDSVIRRECLTAFKTYSSNFEIIKKIENHVRDHAESSNSYCYSTMDGLNNITVRMIETLKNNSSTFGISNFAWGMAVGGALLVAIPGHAAGKALSSIIIKSTIAVIPKLALDKLAGPAMKVVFDENGKYLSYFAADLLIDATLERLLSKALETFGMLIGAVGGGATGFFMKDISYDSLKDLCLFYKKVEDEFPNLAKNVDSGFIDTLLSLPSDIFPQEHKEKIKKMTHGVSSGRLFDSPFKTHGKNKQPLFDDESESEVLTERPY